jgi:hypothetical protein
VGHAAVRVHQTEARLMAGRSRGSLDHNGMVRVVMVLPEFDRSDFEKIKSKSFKKVVDPRPRTARSGRAPQRVRSHNTSMINY